MESISLENNQIGKGQSKNTILTNIDIHIHSDIFSLHIKYADFLDLYIFDISDSYKQSIIVLSGGSHINIIVNGRTGE